MQIKANCKISIKIFLLLILHIIIIIISLPVEASYLSFVKYSTESVINMNAEEESNSIITTVTVALYTPL